MASKLIKLYSWNVNGLRAAMKKGFLDTLHQLDTDVLAIQETKLQAQQLTSKMTRVDGYRTYFSHCTAKKGYSGVGAYTRLKPSAVYHGLGIERFDSEGRILRLDFDDFILFNVYFPNGQMSAERLQYKLDFYEAFFEHAGRLRRQGHSLVICGDFNTAHNEIDLKNPGPNSKRSGFLRIERDWLDRIVAEGYVDTFRILYPETVKYSWWTYRFNARKNNAGWRIDYFFVTADVMEKGWVKDAVIATDIMGSDHCPVGLILEI